MDLIRQSIKLVTLLCSAVFSVGCASDCDQLTASDLVGTCVSKIPSVSERQDLALPNVASEQNQPLSDFSLLRVTNNSDAEKENAPLLKHHYSRRQAWNSDETLIDLTEAIIDATSFEPVIFPVPLSTKRNWSNINPGVMYGIQHNKEANEFVRVNIKTNQIDLIHHFEEYKVCTIGQAEGNLTDNDERVVLTCRKSNDALFDILAFDIKNNKVLGKIEAKENLNWASYSRTGKYILVENNTYPDPNPEIIRYDFDLDNPTTLLFDPQHGDFALDSDGNDVYAMLMANEVQYIRLADRLRVSMPIGRSRNSISHGHISCRANQQPDWCYLSTYKDGHVGAVKLAQALPVTEEVYDIGIKPKKGEKIYVHWGFHRSSSDNYAAEAKATVNRSGTKILFTSDWNGEHATEEFILQVNSDAGLISEESASDN